MAGNSAFSDVEKEAMKARAKEAREFKKLSGEQQIQLKLEEMSKSDKALALKVHKLVLQTAPELEAKTWYGMPAYYLNDKVICFFQAASKFKVRYCTFGFQEAAQVDDGEFWPTSYALTKMTPEVEKKIAKLVKRAVGR
ncbi:MAG: hypothetical protein RIR89_898 [Actinomycetota bacterium]